MDPHHPATPQRAAPLTSHARLERISEPWSLNRSVAIIVTLVSAMVLGSWAASGEIENIILFAVVAAAVLIIVFVQDYWWTPPLVISALGLGSTALGFPAGGIEFGLIILVLTFPTKMAMKTLRKAEPEIDTGLFYKGLVTFVAVHAVVILFYNKVEGTLIIKNIVKAYYIALTPLVFYGLLMRYCNPRTIRPTVIVLFFVILFAISASCFTLMTGISFDPFSDLRITVTWLDPSGAMTILRSTGPILFIGSLAFLSCVRSGAPRFFLAVGLIVSAVGTLMGGGRIPMAVCAGAGIFFAAIRGKLWLALPFVFAIVLLAAVTTAVPDLLYSLPVNVQRALAPLNFSEQKTEVQGALQGSDDWHRELRTRSLDYWTMDTNSFWLGHGYKPWDPSIVSTADNSTFVDQEALADIAVQMGITENMFSSITNIFGAVGLILYSGFLLNLAWTLFKACRVCPPGTDARALCEFSLVNLLAALVFAAVAGGALSFVLLYWTLGLLAARPYLGVKKPVPARAPAEVPAFARPAFAERMSNTRPGALRPGRL